MAEFQNFNNADDDLFNIHIEANGSLHFKANNIDGGGDTRMVIDNNSGKVTIGGDGGFGQLQLKSNADANTIFIGGTGTEATATLGGAASGQDGRIKLFDSSGRNTIDLFASDGVLKLGTEGRRGLLTLLDNAGDENVELGNSDLKLFSSPGGKPTVDLDGGTAGHLELFNPDKADLPIVVLSALSGSLTLGGHDINGDISIKDDEDNTTISCSGNTGHIECDSLTVTGLNLTEGFDGQRRTDIAPLMNALDSVLALRGVRYQRTQVTAATAAAAGDAQQIGFVGQEVEAACPELVTTDAKGRKSVSYSRMTVVLVEAIKEQQQLIREQAAALDEALGKISAIEAGLASHR